MNSKKVGDIRTDAFFSLAYVPVQPPRKSQFLTKWAKKHEEMFPGDNHDIPREEELSLAKLSNRGIVTSDTCNAARSLSKKLITAIEELAKDKDDETESLVLKQDCHHHMRNIWIGAINRFMSKYLFILLKEHFDNLDKVLCVSTCFEQILITLDKLFSLR